MGAPGLPLIREFVNGYREDATPERVTVPEQAWAEPGYQ